jgi:hypothetical protein
MKNLHYIPLVPHEGTCTCDVGHIKFYINVCVQCMRTSRPINPPSHKSNREFPSVYELAKESKLRESPYLIDSP